MEKGLENSSISGFLDKVNRKAVVRNSYNHIPPSIPKGKEGHTQNDQRPRKTRTINLMKALSQNLFYFYHFIENKKVLIDRHDFNGHQWAHGFKQSRILKRCRKGFYCQRWLTYHWGLYYCHNNNTAELQ